MEAVRTDAGYVSGMVLGERGKQVHVYRGIPYAAPPLGDLRWQPPQPVAPWAGVRQCTAFSAVAPQSSTGLSSSGELPESEDCLYLNVLSPAETASERLPVMVWMHGGGLTYASANDKVCNGLSLPLNGVVLVTVNMRLGPMGCLAHPLLSRESPQGASGNYLFLDMVAALQWVRRNISAFGGNPDCVTIFGESGGSTKVINLMASPLAKGLFHRAIGQSWATRGTPLKEMETLGEKVFARLGVAGDEDPLASARALPWKRIIEANMAVAAELNTSLNRLTDSVVDGWFLRDTPANVFKAGKQNAVPFILGANLGELTGPGPIVIPQVVPAYVNLFAGAAKVGGRAYAYIFDHVPASWKRDGVVSIHGLELAYVFGHFDLHNDWLWPVLYEMAKASGAKSAAPGLTDADRRVSEVMMRMWTNFAKTGETGLKGVVDWPAYEGPTDRYLYIAEHPQVRPGFSRVGPR